VTGQDEPASRPAQARAMARFEDLIHQLSSRRHVRHALLAVEAGDRSFGWGGARGDARPDGTPMEVDTLFPLASITKLYTATVVLRLVEQGSLDLDASLETYLPGLGVLHHRDGADHTAELTPRHLLTHTSGLPDYYLDVPKGGRSFHQRLVEEGDRRYSLDEVLDVVRALPARFPPQPLASGRKVKARYSDTNFQLLGATVEQVTGLSYGQALAEHVLGPLGLARTHLAGQVPSGEPVASIWSGEEHLEIAEALVSMAPEGGLIATAGDVLRFARALFSGEVFDDPTTLDAMHAHWYRFGFPRDRAAVMAPGWPIEYGLGVMRFQAPRLLSPLRRTPPVFGHTGASASWLFHEPELDVTFVGTLGQTNAAGVPFRLVPRVLRICAELR
jgi:D-alanyl-D-alanine carboxypeptidase